MLEHQNQVKQPGVVNSAGDGSSTRPVRHSNVAVPLDAFHHPAPPRRGAPKVVDLFAGAGGFSLGFGLAGARIKEVDAKGQVLAMVDALGARTEYTYGPAGERLAAKDAAGNTTRFEYDALGRLTKAIDALGGERRTEYDAEGRVVATVDERGARGTLRYDSAGRLVENTGPDGATTTQAYCADVPQPCGEVDALGGLTLREFDPVGRLTRQVDPLGRESTQGYDSAGRLNSVSGPNQLPATYSYGGNGLVSLKRTWGLVDESYSYDSRGNRTQLSSGGRITAYTYSLANRLLTETNPLGQVTRYTYDVAGNRVTKTDAAGQVTSYTYDKSRRLTKVTFSDGTAYEYGYDSRGARTLEKGPSHERLMGYDALGRLLRVEDVTLGRTLEYPLTDALGSVVAVTDSTGAVVRTNSYEVYGARSTSGTGPNLAFGFTGREHDATGLNYHRDRYMDPTLGRWGQPDRLGMVDGPNLYGYVRASPVVLRDPQGQSVMFEAGRQVGSLTVEVLMESAGRFMEHAGKETEDGDLVEGLADYGEMLMDWGVAIGVAFGVKANQKCKATKIRRPWGITPELTDKVVVHDRFGKFYRHKSTKYWWTKDQSGHGGSVWKVFKKKGNRLEHYKDADEFGDFIDNKHKGPTGESIPWKDVRGAPFD